MYWFLLMSSGFVVRQGSGNYATIIATIAAILLESMDTSAPSEKPPSWRRLHH
jgi:hypothetical protein